MQAVAQASYLLGVEAHPVHVEVMVGQGLPGFDIVGLPERGVRESRVRVQAALQSLGVRLPPRRLVINLAPGDVRKTGSVFDLAIAVSMLTACQLVRSEGLEKTLLLGELSLDGTLRPVPGALAHVASAKERQLTQAIVPEDNGDEVQLIRNFDIRTASHLREVLDHLGGQTELLSVHDSKAKTSTDKSTNASCSEDWRDIRGQHRAQRALIIAAVGGHHVLLAGPPGSGKTMLARRLRTILPLPSEAESIQIATITSAARGDFTHSSQLSTRPFRAPHHGATLASLVGGGDPVHPGEITLAHRGVLFLDELPEFNRDAIEALRTTMEYGQVCITRANYRVNMPASPQIIAAMNPCPCGYYGDAQRECSCSPELIARYQQRISGPLLDRFDMQVYVPRLDIRQLRRPTKEQAPSSSSVREQVEKARAYREREGFVATPSLDALSQRAEPQALSFLDQAAQRLGLSARGYVKVLKVAHTIRHVEHCDCVNQAHVAEALHYRLLDRHTPRRSPCQAKPTETNPHAHAHTPSSNTR